MGAAPKLGNHPFFEIKTIEAFIKGLQETLGQMATLEIHQGKPFVESSLIQKEDVIAIVKLKAPPLEGCFTISFSKSGLLRVYNSMVGESLTEVSEDVKSTVGEIANMVYGTAKTTLNHSGSNFQMAIPSVILGHHTFSTDHQGATLVIPFFFDPDQKIFLQITVNQ